MKPLGIYMLEVIVCSGLLLAFYQLLLARKIGFRACRRFLLGSALLSVVIPALRLPILPARTVYLEIPLAGAAGGAADALSAAEADAGPAAAAFPWQGVLLALYGAVVLLLLVLLVRNLMRINRLRKASRLTPLPDYTLAEHPRVRSPFSFWRTIFLLDEERPDADERAIIVAHEAAHVRHRHSRDKVALGVIKALFWFNPFFWMMERMLSEVQEYEADADVLKAGYSIDNYRLAIFKQLFGYYPDLTSGLSHSLTKKRFVMMNQAPRGTLSWLRLCAVLPLFAGLLVAFGATARPSAPAPQRSDQAGVQGVDSPITILIAPISGDGALAGMNVAPDGTIRIDGKKVAGATVSGTLRASVTEVSEVLVNGEPVALEKLAQRIDELRGASTTATVNVVADPQVSMAVIDRVKNELRKAAALKVNYRLTGEAPAARQLPVTQADPFVEPAGAAPKARQHDALTGVAREDLCMIRVNANDKVLFGSQVSGSDEEFLRLGTDFLRKHGARTAFCLVFDKGASYNSYRHTQGLVQQIYDAAREDLAQRRYGRAFAALQPAEQRAVMEAVPVNVAEADLRDTSGR